MRRRAFLAGAVGAMGVLRAQGGAGRAPWVPVLTHTHNWRWPDDKATAPFEETEKKLVEWCAKLGIRAAGVGSPWNPTEAASYLKYEGPERDLYYSGKLDPKKLMDRESVIATIAMLNRESHGRTLFFLDNENPKGNLGHMWWFGYHYDLPAWNDYSQDRPVKRFPSDPNFELNKITGLPHTRRDLFEIMAIQHRAGALGVFAHPTRWWLDDGQFVTNIAALAPLFLAVYGRLDGITVMGDRTFQPQYQTLWFHFLDTGAWVGGFAETDYLLNLSLNRTAAQTFLNYMPLGNNVTLPKIVGAARRGEVFASNGPFVTLRVDGQSMGSVVRSGAGQSHTAVVEAHPAPGQSTLGRVELIGRGGKVIATRSEFVGGNLEFPIDGTAEPGYLIARVFGEGDGPELGKMVKHHAITNPVYLHPAGFQVHPASTRCRVQVSGSSPWLHGLLEFQTPLGAVLRSHKVTEGTIEETVPADSKIVVQKEGQRALSFFIAMENADVERYLQPLIHGEFRKEHPEIKPGEVPMPLYLPQLQKAIERFEYSL